MIKQLSRQAFSARCQKRNHKTVGTWMARRIARPAALRVTRIVAPLGISANVATFIAWTCALAAAVVFACGTPSMWLFAAVLFQTWYLWDHVDGQLARLRGTVSLEGAQLDFLMHHTVNLLIPLGVGYGCFTASGQTAWLAIGTVWAVAMLLIPLRHDTAYRAMIGRLQHLDGTLKVYGVAKEMTEADSVGTAGILRRLARLPRKANEIHVVMNTMTLLAIVAFIIGDATLLGARIYLGTMAASGSAVALWSIGRSQVRHETEVEFARYFQVPKDHVLRFHDGLWRVEPTEAAEDRPT